MVMWSGCFERHFRSVLHKLDTASKHQYPASHPYSGYSIKFCFIYTASNHSRFLEARSLKLSFLSKCKKKKCTFNRKKSVRKTLWDEVVNSRINEMHYTNNISLILRLASILIKYITKHCFWASLHWCRLPAVQFLCFAMWLNRHLRLEELWLQRWEWLWGHHWVSPQSPPDPSGPLGPAPLVHSEACTENRAIIKPCDTFIGWN